MTTRSRPSYGRCRTIRPGFRYPSSKSRKGFSLAFEQTQTLLAHARETGLLTGPFPNQGLAFPKTEEKPPFQTWDDIQRQLGRGGLLAADEKALWDSLFLYQNEASDVLNGNP